MPIQTIRDPKTGEERRVYVSSGGMGTGLHLSPGRSHNHRPVVDSWAR
jgi:hypothetical protein